MSEIRSEVEIYAMDNMEMKNYPPHIRKAYMEGVNANYEDKFRSEDNCPYATYSTLWHFWISGYNLLSIPVYHDSILCETVYPSNVSHIEDFEEIA